MERKGRRGRGRGADKWKGREEVSKGRGGKVVGSWEGREGLPYYEEMKALRNNTESLENKRISSYTSLPQPSHVGSWACNELKRQARPHRCKKLLP